MESFERKKLADHIKEVRKSERKDDMDTYVIHRSGSEYLYTIGGLKHLFAYIRKLKSNRVLDVGAGDGNASYRISKMQIASGIDLNIAVLRNTRQLAKYFPLEKIHVTDVESLRGIENESLAGVIGVNSIAYSPFPELAVNRLKEVLVPGGIVKATFHTPGGSETNKGLTFSGPEKFVEAFKAAGFDVRSKSNEFTAKDRDSSYGIKGSTVLAIKPGNSNSPTAKKLLDLDFEGIKSDTVGRVNHNPVFDIRDDTE